ncbi:MAG: BMC domain-containing protein, partial [Clostridia bacterium]|nr:BMC domain-containing protein [Clostridia bacterium]
MKREALGMIETRGLVPAIEAADAGVKAANVRLVGYEIVKGGLVMVAFVGEVAAVQASVDAGAAAGEKVGQVISTHVIPRPEADLRMVFTGKKAVEPENDPEPDPPGNGNRKKMSGIGTEANQYSEDIKEIEEPGRKESPSDPDGSGDNGQDESAGDDHEKIGEA